jgi:hypothetical protein
MADRETIRQMIASGYVVVGQTYDNENRTKRTFTWFNPGTRRQVEWKPWVELREKQKKLEQELKGRKGK